uniref:glutathione transferase n=1 Tax=Anopheles christyi TaxID=43041 RepID=A0A182JTD4_9DIPT
MDLYYNILSPPSRAILLLGEALQLKFNLISLDVHRKDYVNPAFKKINPQHTVPTLVVDGVAICEPGAILIYLAEQYAPAGTTYYPPDHLRRAIVNQRLLFECGTLYKCIFVYYSPVVLERATPVETDRQKLDEAVAVLDGILQHSAFVAGDCLTVADYSLVCTVSMLVVLKFDLAPYAAVRRWYERCKEVIAGYTELTQRAVTIKIVQTMDFYYHPASPYCRSVMLVAKALKLNLNMQFVDLMKDEQLRPTFAALNPFHCVPTLVDNDLTMWESRAILVYLVDKYGRTNSRLYPKDAKTRAIINQRLFFDHGSLGTRLEEYYYPLFFEGATPGGEKLEKLEEALEVLNGYLINNPYAAGPNITLADYSLVATVSTLEVVQHDLSKYPAISAWYDGCKAIMADFQEINEDGMQQYRAYFESGLTTAPAAAY